MGMLSNPRNWWMAAALAAAAAHCAAPQAPVVLDRVVAVVNNRAILSSDVDNELRVSVLEPESSDHDHPTAQAALDDLISRALIEQQIRQEDTQAAHISKDKVNERIGELRKNLPACVSAHCTTEDGWKEFLRTNGLTEPQVEAYVRRRLEILSFIEDRFRQGIRISQEDIDAYYRESLVPMYAKGEKPPPLSDVSPRIEEILLQQQVNALFGAWLDNLRKQGDIEILDPALEHGDAPPAERGEDQ